MTLTDEDILARLVAIEDSTVERKTVSDNRAWIKAAVAFSNSLEDDQPGVLFVGVFDDGRIQDQGATNFTDLQKRVSGELSNIYPPIYPTLLVREKDGKKFLAVIIYGSPERPHFAGKSYVRDGTQTRDASEANIQELIAKRNSKAAEILKWKGKEITLRTSKVVTFHGESRKSTVSVANMLVDCNQYWITLKGTDEQSRARSIPLKQIELNYDHDAKRLMLECQL
jgi:Predicted transcriptional regulator containing an HTH domain and an uncharacterized domain shared with the mammalian protein Schlafen